MVTSIDTTKYLVGIFVGYHQSWICAYLEMRRIVSLRTGLVIDQLHAEILSPTGLKSVVAFIIDCYKTVLVI